MPDQPNEESLFGQAGRPSRAFWCALKAVEQFVAADSDCISIEPPAPFTRYGRVNLCSYKDGGEDDSAV